MDRIFSHEDRSGNRRDFRSSPRSRNTKCMRSHTGRGALEEDGVVRMKILLTKQQLRQLMAVTGKAHFSLSTSSLALDQLLRLTQKRYPMRGGQGSWRPALQSIPEEI